MVCHDLDESLAFQALPVRVIPNGDGVDVLFTLMRPPGQSNPESEEGLASMQRELANLKTRHEG